MARTYPAANDGMSASALSTLSIRSRFICNRFYTYSSSTLHYVFLSQLQSQKYTFLWYESTFNYFYYLCLLFEEYHVCFFEGVSVSTFNLIFFVAASSLETR